MHFAVMQLHQLNFFGFEKTLLNIPGVPLLLMGFSGLALWGFQRARGATRENRDVRGAGRRMRPLRQESEGANRG